MDKTRSKKSGQITRALINCWKDSTIMRRFRITKTSLAAYKAHLTRSETIYY